MDDVKLVSGIGSRRPGVILYAHTAGPFVLARMIVHRGPVIVAAHITPASFLGSIRGARYFLRLVSRYLRFVYNRADAIVAVSASAATELESLEVRAPVTVLYNSIDEHRIRELLPSRESLREEFSWHDQVIVLAVGQIQPRKGVEDFIRCAQMLPDLRFTWVGGMPFGFLSAERGKMLRLRAGAPPNVDFVGMKSRSDVFRFYAAADIFFLPSRHETFGLAVLEAATAGLPIVVRDLACYREWLGGAYLTGRCAEEFSEHLRKLVQPDSRRRQGECASHAVAEHGFQALTTELRKTLDSLTDRPVPPPRRRE
jgi:1,2-diacylglycerol-3-alpha-glucose alpha-1,2-galactosyltransferase